MAEFTGKSTQDVLGIPTGEDLDQTLLFSLTDLEHPGFSLAAIFVSPRYPVGERVIFDNGLTVRSFALLK